MAVSYYGEVLSRVHERGFGHHAAAQAPDILALLEAVRGGLVLEVGCGSGHLTAALVAAGHRLLATDASEAMLAIAREKLGERAAFGLLRLPADPVPECDAIVSTGHALNYLEDAGAVAAALLAFAGALRPGGVLALDLLDVSYGAARADLRPALWQGEGLFCAVEFALPSPTRFVRRITVFSEETKGSWRRSDELHRNLLLETAALPPLLEAAGLTAAVRPSFGGAPLPAGMVALVAEKR